MKIMNLNYCFFWLITICTFPIFCQSKKTEKLLIKAKNEIRVSNFDEAILHLNKIIEKENLNTDAHFLRGMCYDSLKIYSNAIKDYDKVISFSGNILAYKSRAIVKIKTKLFLQAIIDLDHYLAINSSDAQAYSLRAYSKYKLNYGYDYNGIISDESKAIELNTNHSFLIGNSSLNGEGVIVGIIDGGFDFTHPTFYDTTYSKLRISKAWIQSISGIPPIGYTYGAEFKGEEILLEKKYDYENSGSHGTMVSSVAVGSGIGSPNIELDRGVAYESEIVIVSLKQTYKDWREMNMTTVIDAINYIFSYAESKNKPAVINISSGSLYGARDGGSLFSRACDSLVGKGKILVFSAMNEGSTKRHIGKTFTESDTVLHTLVPIDIYNNGERRNYIDVWGDSLENHCLQYGMYSNGIVRNKSNKYCLENSTSNIFIIGSDKDTCYITIQNKKQDYNNRSHSTIDIFSKSKDTLAISLFAKNTNVHMWQEYFDESWQPNSGAFLGNDSWATEGDDNYTIGEMGCTKSAITVGASVNRVFWTDLKNVVYWDPSNRSQGKLADYTSKGPTFNKIMKPDITAPGGLIFCASNSYDSTSVPESSQDYSLVSQFTSPKNSRQYYYMAEKGTSFASPFVAGSVALMLQINPYLEPEEIKTILRKTAIRDNFTSLSPDSTQWGAGKINISEALKETIRSKGTLEIPKNETEIKIFQNSVERKLTLDFESLDSGYFFVELANSKDELIQSKVWKVNRGNNQLNLSYIKSKDGVYSICIFGRSGKIILKSKFN